MSEFESLLGLSAEQKQERGLEFTPAEIAQQPAIWVKIVDLLLERKQEIRAFLDAAGIVGNTKADLILAGAGSSEFIGNAVAPALRRRLRRTVTSMATTHLVTHPQVFIPRRQYAVLSFARSGNSPESLATYNLVRQLRPEARQIAITCNKDGALARQVRGDANSFCIELPEETNDKSLVMTSSVTTMALCALGLTMLDKPRQLAKTAAAAAQAGRRILQNDLLPLFASRPFTRACYLGSGVLNGAMQECQLKIQEMTEGRVAPIFNSFVGLRHGPQVFVNSDCAVVAAVSSDPYVRQYELDLLRELKAKKQGCCMLILCARATDEIRQISSDVVELCDEGQTLDDDFRVMTDVMVGQILGVFACLRCNLKPDNPSTSGTINRVVQGVTIYPYGEQPQ